MKRLAGAFVVFMMIFILVGCDSAEDHIGEAKTPSGSEAMKGRQYQEVVEDFEEKGFTNIQLDKLEDLVTGWMTKDGEVEKVSVGGDGDYSPDRWVVSDTAVIITYHTFPEKEESSSSSSEKSESGESGEVESSDSQQPKVDEESFTIDNNIDLAEVLLLKDNLDPAIKSFAEKYDERIIEFDANIADVAKHKDYKTRYDILVYAGDYSETECVGPSFKFEDVSIVSDLNLTGSNIPDNLVVGQHIRVTVKIKEYRENSGLLIIKPVITKIRE